MRGGGGGVGVLVGGIKGVNEELLAQKEQDDQDYYSNWGKYVCLREGVKKNQMLRGLIIFYILIIQTIRHKL